MCKKNLINCSWMHLQKMLLRCINAVGCAKKRHAPRCIHKMQAILSLCFLLELLWQLNSCLFVCIKHLLFIFNIDSEVGVFYLAISLHYCNDVGWPPTVHFCLPIEVTVAMKIGFVSINLFFIMHNMFYNVVFLYLQFIIESILF